MPLIKVKPVIRNDRPFSNLLAKVLARALQKDVASTKKLFKIK